jgi:hypothetical protein
MESGLYEIAVRGTMRRDAAVPVTGFDVVSTSEGETRFVGWVHDQCALHGALEQVFGLGLELRSVQRLDDTRGKVVRPAKE